MLQMVQIILIIAIVLLCLFFLYFMSVLLAVFLVHRKLFLVRGSDPSNPCYLRFEDYPELERTPYRVGFYGKVIQGYFYKRRAGSSDRGLIILSHGFFGTHIQYLADIYYLTGKGYEVLAYDQYGVGESEGQNQVSLSNGIYVLENVLRDVKKRNLANGREIILYGHSWGAYCSLGALASSNLVSKVILRSGFLSPSKEILYLLKGQSKKLYYFIRPLYRLVSHLIFGRKNDVSLEHPLPKKVRASLLVLHAMDDDMVPPLLSIALYFNKHPDNRVQVVMTEKGHHNSLIAEEGISNYQRLIREYQKILSQKGEDQKQRIQAFEASLERRNLYPYNREVTDTIDNFLD